MAEQQITPRRVSALILSCGAILTGSAAHGQESASSIWSLASDGIWNSQVVSLGAQGNRVLTQTAMNSGEFLIFSGETQDPPVAIVDDPIASLAVNSMVDSAVGADRHVGAYQRKDPQNQAVWQTVLTGFDAGGPNWEFVFPVTTGLFPGSDVAISDDGQTVVGVLRDYYSSVISIACIDGVTGALNRLVELPPMGQFKGTVMSGDGSTVVVNPKSRLIMIDVPTGQVLNTISVTGQESYGALGISDSGDVVVFGTLEKISVYRRQAGAFALSSVLTLPAGVACRRLAISPDGTRLACGLWYVDRSPLIDIRAYNLDSGALTMHFEAPVAGALDNLVNGIDITNDGTRFAVGMYGDEQNSLPEVLVFDVDSDQPVLTIDRPGSILDLDMSGDGTKLAIATKGEHYNIGGGLGSVDLFDISTNAAPADFRFVGQPSLGSVIRFEQDLGASSYARVLTSELLDPNPTVFGNIGTLYLNRSRLAVLPVGSVNNSGQMITPFPVQGVSAGTTLYFQGLAIGPRKLTENFIELTVLP